ncbi:MAG TPA: UDP-N-acetylmuramoyl-tripeptide--D-alanyl-D-alanine ligase [Chthoniobacterales bacterium]
MNPRPLRQLAGWLGQKLADGEFRVDRVVTDSRQVRPGDLFVALRGERFDGHQFVVAARQKGAVGAVVTAPAHGLDGWPQLVVPDTVAAFQRLAAAHRASLPLVTVSVTGSNGKTSTKEMIAAVLGARFRVAKTSGNFNNHLGVPHTLLSFTESDEFGVVEMGMNHAGELAPLALMTGAQAAVITNIGMAHIGHFASIEAIAAEKATVAEAVSPGGVVVLNANARFTPFVAGRCRARVVTAGLGRGDLRAEDVHVTADGARFTAVVDDGVGVDVALPVTGEHMVANATLALAVGCHFGVTLDEAGQALRNLKLPDGRLRVQQLGRVLIVNDAYNANPDSVAAALHAVAVGHGNRRKVAVLGRMAELGDHALEGHRRVGRCAAAEGFDCVVTVGEEAAEIGAAATAAGLPLACRTGSHEEAVQLLCDLLQDGDVLLVKGSASAQMNRVIQGLEALQKEGKWTGP